MKLGLDNLQQDDAKRTYLFLDVKKMYYPNPVKINTIFMSKKQMKYACNSEFKQVLKASSRQRLRVINGTDD